MTFVFRSSTFFVVFVISFKVTTFIMDDTSLSVADGRMGSTVERLIDEAVRLRHDMEEAADSVVTMAEAISVMGRRSIHWMQANGFRVVQRAFVSVESFIHGISDVMGRVSHALDGKTGKQPFVSLNIEHSGRFSLYHSTTPMV